VHSTSHAHAFAQPVPLSQLDPPSHRTLQRPVVAQLTRDVHDSRPWQWTSQSVVAVQVIALSHADGPQVIAQFSPEQVIGSGHDSRPVHSVLQVFAAHVMAFLHEPVPHVMSHVSPAHLIVSVQASLPMQLMSQLDAVVQSIGLRHAPMPQLIVHGMPAGHVMLASQIEPVQSNVHEPATHAPPAPSHASSLHGNGAGASAGAPSPVRLPSPGDPSPLASRGC
jgi:hypothetical protein